ncbi:MAG: YbhN family protein [Planctomycetota bacterium]
MNRKSIITTLQVVLAVALLAFVLSNVPLSDRAEPKDKTLAVITGEIAGPAGVKRPWEAGVVEFKKSGGAEIVNLSKEEFDVRPGLFTLYKKLAILPYLAGALLLLFGAWVASVRWWLLTRVLSIPFSVLAALKWSFVGFFFNNVVPGLIGGDLPKMYFVARLAPNKTHAVLTVVVDRLLGLLALAMVASTAFLIDYDRYTTQPDLAWMKWLLFGVLGGLLGGMFMIGNATIRNLLFPPARLAKIPGGKIIATLNDAAALYRGAPGTLGICLLLSVMNHVLSLIAWWLFVEALGGILSLGATFVVVPIVQMIKSAPLSPSGWGVGEFAFQKLLPLYGESATLGVALSITYNLTYLVFSLAGGIILLTSRDRVSAAEMQASLNTKNDSIKG